MSKGTWVALGGESDIDNTTATEDFVRCTILSNGLHVDSTATWERGSSTVGLSLIGTVKLKSPATIGETCTRDVASEVTNSYEGSLVLIKV